MQGVGRKPKRFVRLISLMFFLFNLAFSDTPLVIQLKKDAELSSKTPTVVATVVQDVTDAQGKILIPKGAEVYGIMRYDKASATTYLEFTYAKKGGKQWPLRGYLVAKKISVSSSIYLLFILFPPLFVVVWGAKVGLSAAFKYKQLKKHFRNCASKEQKLWISAIQR